ncbi:alpha/beta-Hydrolases superfamily protein [Striga asiatica]|uniref:Alpha/beta-Hydrolases superfamily protein n=1 Tax=Striga asiatica TaxID=4170 RepID=A0A5A7QR41_STRAF|nr:alpha/beta-Hydrolases superfamily protein [Striga asiatica]
MEKATRLLIQRFGKWSPGPFVIKTVLPNGAHHLMDIGGSEEKALQKGAQKALSTLSAWMFYKANASKPSDPSATRLSCLLAHLFISPACGSPGCFQKMDFLPQ